VAEKKEGLELSPKIVDFDKLAPDKRLARIGGRVIDVTTIPTRVMLEAAKFTDEQESYTNLERIEKTLGIVSRITQMRDPEITTDWLLDHADLTQLMAFIKFCLEPLRASQEKEGEPAAASSSG